MLSSKSKWLWLALGAALLAAAHLRWGIGPLAWVAPVPFLYVLRRSEGWRTRLAVVAALFAGFSLAMLKITTAPLNPAFAFLFALPIAVLQGGAYLLWDRIRRSSHETVAVLSFPALAVSAEYAQHRFTPFASWGAVAYTQLELLPLLQLASVFGMAGVSFVVYFFAAALESLFSRGRAAMPVFVAACTAVCAAVTFGTLRLELTRPGETFDTRARVLLASLPTRRVATVYSRIGDAFALLCALFASCALLAGVRSGQRPRALGGAAPARLATARQRG